jgi:hypothetical protein
MTEQNAFDIDIQAILDPPITKAHIQSLLRRAASRIRGTASREARTHLDFFKQHDLEDLPEGIKQDIFFAHRLDQVSERLDELET